MFVVYGLYYDSNLFYIGKTTADRVGLRLVEHKSASKKASYLVTRKINKLLREGYEVSIKVLHTFDNEEEQLAKEVELIAHYGKVNDGGILYNSADGGIGVIGYTHTEESKKKMSLSKMGHKNNVGIKRPDMVKRWAKKVYLYDLDGNRLDEEYESCHAAGEDLGISYKKVSEHIKCNRKCKVDKWSDYIQFSYEDVEKLPAYEENRKLKRVAQYTLDGNLVREYDSVQEVVDINSAFKSPTIASACNGTTKHAYKFIWKYLN